MGAFEPAAVDAGHAGHRANDIAGAQDRCPTCDQAIPRELSDAVKRTIAVRESEQEARLRDALQHDKRDLESKAAAEKVELQRHYHTELARARSEAETAVAARLADLAEAKRALEAQMDTMRQHLEQEKLLAVQAAQAKSFDENQKSLAKIAELQRQLEKKTAQDLGDGPEVDLFETLKAEFPEDRIQRVEKGAAGADVIHDVYHNGRLAGRIVYDSKNRSAWRNDYVTKLRADQIEANADHAVLASKVFPAGVRELHLQDGVLIVTPGRVLVVANLLRKHIVQSHALRSSNDARAEKSAALYNFILSERCRQLLGTVETQADDLVDLDRKEERAHQALWKRRGELIRSVQRANGDLTFEIDRIIGVAGNGRELDANGDGA